MKKWELTDIRHGDLETTIKADWFYLFIIALLFYLQSSLITDLICVLFFDSTANLSALFTQGQIPLASQIPQPK